MYDASDQYVLYFGGAGASSSSSNATWTFVSGYWTNITSASAPPARLGASMAYDAKDGYVVLFGGLGGLTVGADTWKFHAGAWTQLTPAKSPSARELAQMTYDAADDYVLLYGGLSLGGAGGALGDTWTFAAGKWTRLNLSPGSTAPEQRYGACMAYDAKDGYVVLFSGDSEYKGSYYVENDTYTFSGGVWARLSPSTTPTGRTDAGLAYDSQGNDLLLFGGDGAHGALSDTWTFSGGVWTQLSGTHPSNQSSDLVADPLDGYVFLFVGGGNESWKFVDGGWMPLISAREWAGLVYDAADHYVLLFGGLTGSGPQPQVLSAETWKYVGGVWTNLTASVVGSPSAREWFTMTYDAKDGYVVLFGGDDGTSVLGDTWTYLAGTWTKLSPSTSPSPRILASMTYDAADGYVVLFGGATSLIHLCNDTWEFVGGTWTNLTGTIAPPARTEASMAYDAADGYVLLFGGIGTSSTHGGVLGDTWTYLAGTWTHRLIATHPKYRTEATMTYDAADGYIVLFGGISSGSTGFHSDTWKYLGGVWTKLSTSTSPPGEVRQGSTYDAADGYMVVFGGETSSGALRGDIWEFSAGTYTVLVG